MKRVAVFDAFEPLIAVPLCEMLATGYHNQPVHVHAVTFALQQRQQAARQQVTPPVGRQPLATTTSTGFDDFDLAVQQQHQARASVEERNSPPMRQQQSPTMGSTASSMRNIADQQNTEHRLARLANVSVFSIQQSHISGRKPAATRTVTNKTEGGGADNDEASAHYEVDEKQLIQAIDQVSVIVLLKPMNLTPNTVHVTSVVTSAAKIVAKKRRQGGSASSNDNDPQQQQQQQQQQLLSPPHIILVTGTGATIPNSGISKLRMQCEQIVENSGLPFTIVRPSNLHEKFAQMHARSIREEGIVYNPYHSGAFPSHSANDLSSFLCKISTDIVISNGGEASVMVHEEEQQQSQHQRLKEHQESTKRTSQTHNGAKYTLCQFKSESDSIPRQVATLTRLLSQQPQQDKDLQEQVGSRTVSGTATASSSDNNKNTGNKQVPKLRLDLLHERHNNERIEIRNISDGEFRQRLKSYYRVPTEFEVCREAEEAAIIRNFDAGLVLTSEDYYNVMKGKEVTSFEAWLQKQQQQQGGELLMQPSDSAVTLQGTNLMQFCDTK